MGIEFTTPPSMKCSSPMRVGRQEPRHRGRREDGRDERTGVEDVLRRPLDAGGDHAQRHREVFEPGVRTERPLEDAAQRRRRVEVRLGLDEPRELRDAASRRRRRSPRARSTRASGCRRRRASGSAATCAPLIAPIEVPATTSGADAGLEQRLDHADLDGARGCRRRRARTRRVTPCAPPCPLSLSPSCGARRSARHLGVDTRRDSLHG